jgi:hypothetical protein
MIKKFAVVVLGVATFIATQVAPVQAQTGPSQNIASRLRDVEIGGGTNQIVVVASNTLNRILDFSAKPSWYQIVNANTNSVFTISNLVDGKTVVLEVSGDGSAVHTVTISTNGLTSGTAIIWDHLSPTNGATSCSVTNHATIRLRKMVGGIVRANYSLSR